MSTTKGASNPKKKKPSPILKKIYWIAGIISVVLMFLLQRGLFAIKPTAVVECGDWQMPGFIEKEFQDLWNSIIYNTRTDRLLKSQSMYHIGVSNKSGHTITNARVKIPDADYVEIVREDTKRTEARIFQDLPDMWELGNIENGCKFTLNAWTGKIPDRKSAREIVINHDTTGGCSAVPRIRTPADSFAGWIETKWIIVAAVATIFVVSFSIYRRNFLCRYLCISWS